MQVHLNTSTMRLEDFPMDVGYASEKVTLTDSEGKVHTIGGQNGKTQLIISTPFIDDAFIDELKELSEQLPKGGDYEVTAALVVANDTHTPPELGGIDFFVDSQEEYGDFYGVRLVGEPYGGELTKAAILVSKDGAIFYDDFVENLENRFNTDTLLRKIMAAQTCYTGKGCH